MTQNKNDSHSIEGLSIYFIMLSVTNLTAQPFSRWFEKRFDISLNEWRVMYIIALHPKISQSNVAYYLGMDKMAVSRAVRRLLKHKRVIRQPQSGKKREMSLSLSAAGKQLYNVIATAGALREERLQKGFKPYELEAMRDYLNRFHANARTMSEDDDLE
ncbi:MarR family winged helix-turn-helix transcriptional regulator [Haliea sp.]